MAFYAPYAAGKERTATRPRRGMLYFDQLSAKPKFKACRALNFSPKKKSADRRTDRQTDRQKILVISPEETSVPISTVSGPDYKVGSLSCTMRNLGIRTRDFFGQKKSALAHYCHQKTSVNSQYYTYTMARLPKYLFTIVLGTPSFIFVHIRSL